LRCGGTGIYNDYFVANDFIAECDSESNNFENRSIFGAGLLFAPIYNNSVNVTIQLIQSKCVPALLYGLDGCPLNKSGLCGKSVFYETILYKCMI